jgi:hypothetical protein
MLGWHASRLGFGILLAVTVLAAGCGGGTAQQTTEPTDTTSTMTSAGSLAALVAEGLLAASASDPNALQLTRQQAQCVAEGTVGDLGGDRLLSLGYDPAKGAMPDQDLMSLLTAGERETVASHIEDCVDLVPAVSQALAASGLPEDQAACVAGLYVDSGLLHESLAAAGYDSDLNQRIDTFMAGALESCAG